MLIFTYPNYAIFVPLCSLLIHAKIFEMLILSVIEESGKTFIMKAGKQETNNGN
jgi:hypothetical protein